MVGTNDVGSAVAAADIVAVVVAVALTGFVAVDYEIAVAVEKLVASACVSVGADRVTVEVALARVVFVVVVVVAVNTKRVVACEKAQN